MRKWFLIVAVGVAVGGLATYFSWPQRTTTIVAVLPSKYERPNNVTPPPKNDGNAETCETVEPLVVERAADIASARPSTDEAVCVARVVLTPGTMQPPRPDAGRVRRMPYADEDLELPLNPLTQIEAGLWKLNIFAELLKTTDAVEESENKEPAPPVEQAEPTPMPMPAPDYHHHDLQCPYSGGHCPAPYNYYPQR